VPEPVLAGGQGHFVVQHKVVEACVRRAVRGRSKIRCMVQQIWVDGFGRSSAVESTWLFDRDGKLVE
jgi:hypothetical protein